LAAVVLELEQVAKRYGDAHGVDVLRGVDLVVREGEYVAIVGPSGSGKSTLLNLLGCLDRPTAGRYLFAGEDVASLDDRRLSRLRNARIGFVFQSFLLVPHLTVQENVELPLVYARIGKRERKRRADAVIATVGLSHRASHRPNELSGGENQRAAIARALANDPALLLADEPTGNLDSATSAEIMRALLELHRAGRTLVVITHDREIADAAPRRVAIRDGRIERDDVRAEASA
jgi:putative ABC transport system ATP-binding protein